MMNLLALHYIAAQNGDGLMPELLTLLERFPTHSTAERISISSRSNEEIPRNSPDSNYDGALRVPTDRK